MSGEFINTHFYLVSVILILLSFGIFCLQFEHKKPQAKELVTLAVMSAIAVAARGAFVMVPHFKPMTAIIMITGMAFGARAGFLTGAMSAFVSNFIFGQGAWTPWQMFAYGIAGALAGMLRKKQIIHEEKKAKTAAVGFLIVAIIVGPILDTSTLFLVVNEMTAESTAAIYFSGVPVNIVHGVATFATLFLICRPMMDKLNRIKIKYGMMGGMEHEIR